MTDKQDDTIEERIIAVRVPRQTETMEDDSDDDFSEDDDSIGLSVSADTDVAESELTPNDIFGLDPLDVLTLEELAEYLKVSPAAAHRVIKEQRLPGRNIGGEWRFLRDAVANWLRGQEAPAQQQQKAREDFAKSKAPAPQVETEERFSRPPQRPAYQPEAKRPYQPESSTGCEYRPRQRFPEGGQQYGNQGGGQQYGNQGGGQYGNRGGNQYGSGQSSGGNYGGGGAGGGYTPPPRRPFRSTEGGGQGGYGAAPEGGRGYGGGNAGGGQFSGGGYQAGAQRFSGGPKRKNKRQVFDNEGK